ncbi:MAG: YgfZ/GcvT domain-containing protein, partial [Acidobacteriota bacterium]
MPAPGGSIAVYRAGLDGVLLADRGARGRLFFSGRQVSDLFHRISTNDIRALAPGQGTPSLLLTGKGRILDRLLILAVEGGLLVFTSAGTGEETSERIRKYIVFEEVSTADHTPETFLWELSGPLSVRLLEESAGAPGPEDGWLSLPLGHHRVILMGGRKVRVIRDMDLEAPSFLLCGRAGDWEGVAQVLKEKGTPLGLVFGADVPGGETALEALRIRAGRPAPDHELSEEWTPLEMRAEDALSCTKG